MSHAEFVNNLYAVIMAGGKGTRFWPLSRETFPKQFLKIVGDRTLIQDTMHRLDGLVPPAHMLIVTTGAQRNIVQWQAGEVLGHVNCVVEPMGKNTAPAIALASYKLHKLNPNAMLVVLPSDHFIADTAGFVATIRSALSLAAKGRIVTFGVQPDKPETGYGYIKAGGIIESGPGYLVERFVEKPNLERALSYLKEGGYYWNSGMFLFRAADMIEELRTHMPALAAAFDRIAHELGTAREEQALAEIYPTLPEDSIDYGVMEKSKRMVVVPARFPWSDIGSWSALDDVLDKDADGNVRVGNVVEIDSKDNIFFAGNKLVAAIGIRDMVVVDTADATLIMPKSDVQRVKDLVAKLKEQGKDEYLAPSIEERPWGWFSVLEQSPTHKIKHIYLKPKARLSLQAHNHRSEHWVVVSGTALVQRGEDIFHVHPNESTFIPATTKHRLENPGIIPLRIVEVQSGEYLGEDDIQRFDDQYGRTS